LAIKHIKIICQLPNCHQSTGLQRGDASRGVERGAESLLGQAGDRDEVALEAWNIKHIVDGKFLPDARREGDVEINAADTCDL